jgi:hypothetical protein
MISNKMKEQVEREDALQLPGPGDDPDGRRLTPIRDVNVASRICFAFDE